MIYALIIAAALLAALVIWVGRQPDIFSLSRYIVIEAETEKIFPYLNNTHKGNEWSPWMKMEPNVQISYEGPADGVGAVMKWNGKKTGAGILTITESEENKFVGMRLEFLRPMKAVNRSEYHLESEKNGMRVTWSFTGKNTLLGKVMSLFINCEKMMGEQFEQGLKDLKSLVENAS